MPWLSLAQSTGALEHLSPVSLVSIGFQEEEEARRDREVIPIQIPPVLLKSLKRQRPRLSTAAPSLPEKKSRVSYFSVHLLLLENYSQLERPANGGNYP